MANCGCKPCSKPIPIKPRKCKPFSICVGNNSLIYDGECISITPRKYQIPNGTYTSITFEEGCIVDVGNAPIPEYTPQACCDGEAKPVETGSTGGNVTIGKGIKNLAVLNGNSLSVEPHWDNSNTILLTGDGTADKPWKQEVKLSTATGNRLTKKNDGLYAGVKFSTSDNVTITGEGTEESPYKFEVKSPNAKLAEINKEELDGNGFSIDKQGLVHLDGDVSFVTNLEFSSDAFQVVNTGVKTQVVVDEQKLKTGSSLVVEGAIKGKGITGDPLKIEWSEQTLTAMLDEIGKSDTLKQKLKQMLGV